MEASDDRRQNQDVPLQVYIDGQLAEIRRAVDIASASSSGEAVPLREYIEAIFEEHRRALVSAEQEREKAATALREDERRRNEIAEREREKAASALRDGLARQIHEGDERLREHIANQIEQINRALESGEKLEVNRVRAIEERMGEQRLALEMAEREREKAASALRQEAHRAEETAAKEREKAALALRDGLDRSIHEGDKNLREHIAQQIAQLKEQTDAYERLAKQRHEAAQEAIAKAESANEKRFESVNAFRTQLAEQTGSFVPREVFEARMDATDARVAGNTGRLDRESGRDEGTGERRANGYAGLGAVLGLVGGGVGIAGVVTAIIVALA